MRPGGAGRGPLRFGAPPRVRSDPGSSPHVRAMLVRSDLSLSRFVRLAGRHGGNSRWTSTQHTRRARTGAGPGGRRLAGHASRGRRPHRHARQARHVRRRRGRPPGERVRDPGRRRPLPDAQRTVARRADRPHRCAGRGAGPGQHRRRAPAGVPVCRGRLPRVVQPPGQPARRDRPGRVRLPGRAPAGQGAPHVGARAGARRERVRGRRGHRQGALGRRHRVGPGRRPDAVHPGDVGHLRRRRGRRRRREPAGRRGRGGRHRGVPLLRRS